MKKSPVMLRVTMVVMAALVGVLAAAVTTARPAFASRRHVQHHVSTTASAMPPIKVSTTTKEYLEALGMPYEEHGVQTDDGYILTVFRIPQLDPSGKPRSDSKPVILQHGILASSWCWLANEPKLAPAVVLWNQGYDVWLTNSRGNTYSQNHTTFKTHSKEFWNFTWGDMGRFDVPAAVDYVVKATGHQKVSYVGWSQGNSMMLVAASGPSCGADEHALKAQQTVNEYVDLWIALSPVSYMSHQQSWLLGTLSRLHLADLVNSLFPYGFLADPFWDSGISDLEKLLCKVTLGLVCKLSVDLVCGTSSLDSRSIIDDRFVSHFPAGTSTKDVNHYEQLIERTPDCFCEYSYGTQGNKNQYGSDPSPAFNVSAVNVPVALFHGTSDDLVNEKDYDLLVQSLPNATVVADKRYENYSHLTWFVAVESAANSGWYLDDAVDLLSKYPAVTHGLKSKHAKQRKHGKHAKHGKNGKNGNGSRKRLK